MAAVIKSKGGKMYRNNLDDDEDDSDNNNTKKLNGKMSTKNSKPNEDEETSDSDSESDMSEMNQSAAIPINEWDDKPVLTPAG